MTRELEELATRLYSELAEWEREDFAARVLTNGVKTENTLRSEIERLNKEAEGMAEEAKELREDIKDLKEQLADMEKLFDREWDRAEALAGRVAELEAELEAAKA